MRKLIRYLGITCATAVAISVMLMSASVYTFYALTDETLIAELRFEQVARERYRAYLSTGDFCEESVYGIAGDQWRIDAEFVKWYYWATLLGLESQYRLDRLEGRFSDVDDQNSRTGQAHSLKPATALDVVALADTLGPMNFLMDASYGSSTYQTIEPGRIYSVYKSPTGIFTRSEPVPVAPEGDAIEIEIRQACGASPGVWYSVSTWVDRLLQPVGI